MVIAYTWAALGPDSAGLPVALGISGRLSDARKAAAEVVESGRAFLGDVTEVCFVLGADLDRHYMPSGRWWHGRLDSRGRMRWFQGV